MCLCVHTPVCLVGLGDLCIQVDLSVAPPHPTPGYKTSACHFLSPGLHHPLMSRENNGRMTQ